MKRYRFHYTLIMRDTSNILKLVCITLDRLQHASECRISSIYRPSEWKYLKNQ